MPLSPSTRRCRCCSRLPCPAAPPSPPGTPLADVNRLIQPHLGHEHLPALPASPREAADAEALALSQRLDVLAARSMLEQAARQTELARTTRFVSMVELGTVRNSSNEQPTQRGWEVSLELPLFGPDPLPRAQTLARQAAHEAADTPLRARSEVREAHGLYRGAFDIARHHRDELMPLARRIADEQQLRYNGMLIGVFELLADARSQVNIHGHEFTVTGTDGGPVPRTARWPEVTTDIAVGQMRQLEFIADEEGDRTCHCHKATTR